MLFNDPIGLAAHRKMLGQNDLEIIVQSDICDDDIIPVDYLFRKLDNMPKIEQKALNYCEGDVLDVGAGVGCHSILLQENGVNVLALEMSQGCCDVMKQVGVENIECRNFYMYDGNRKFDTILLLMNGIGIAGNIIGLPDFFAKCKQLLTKEGQVIFDSSDISYLFEESLEQNYYYGEVVYNMKFEDMESGWFNWLFVDFETIKTNAEKHGFLCEKIMNGNHYDYLARLTIK